MSYASEVTAYKHRESRITALRSSSPVHQLARLTPLEHQFELALARVAGTRLKPAVVARMVEGLILDPDVLMMLSGVKDAALPTNSDGWDRYAREAIKSDSLAQLCIDSSDATKREELRQEYIKGLKPDQKINKSRNGVLDEEADAYALAAIQRSAGIL